MTAKPKSSRRLVSDKRMPKASLLERLDRPTGPDLRPELLSSVLSSLNPQIKAIEDLKLDIAWLKAELESKKPKVEVVEATLWPLWTMLIVELVGLAALFAKVCGLAPQLIGGSP
jgi:hypothetical protein